MRYGTWAEIRRWIWLALALVIVVALFCAPAPEAPKYHKPDTLPDGTVNDVLQQMIVRIRRLEHDVYGRMVDLPKYDNPSPVWEPEIGGKALKEIHVNCALCGRGVTCTFAGNPEYRKDFECLGCGARIKVQVILAGSAVRIDTRPATKGGAA